MLRAVSRLKILLACALAATAFAPLDALAATTVIHAGHLIADPGKPVRANQSILVEDGKIVAVKDGFVPGDKVIELPDAWVMPGLIDMHTHVTDVLDLSQPIQATFLRAYMGRPSQIVLAMLPRVKALLLEGFTTVRNVGDPSSTTYDLRDAINTGAVVGPRMFATEPQMGIAGGDYDASRWGVRRELEQYVTSRGVCSGVADCTRAVREEVNRGADLIKFRQDFAPFLDPRVKMVESEDEVRAIIDTAHKLDRRVAVHVVGSPDFLHMVIAGGADTIEHGPLDDQAIALMKAHGTSFTPTLLAAKLVEPQLFATANSGLLKAYKAGVPIIYGTDLGIFGPERSHEEFSLMAAAGLPPEQVLRAATVNAAAALGPLGENLGSIAPGKLADIIAMKVDPLTHIEQVADPAAVVFVMKQGEVFKDAH